VKSINQAAAVAAIACVTALSASPAPADVISNPTNTDSFLYLSGAVQGGQSLRPVCPSCPGFSHPPLTILEESRSPARMAFAGF
jgi:hypothetical protein